MTNLIIYNDYFLIFSTFNHYDFIVFTTIFINSFHDIEILLLHLNFNHDLFCSFLYHRHSRLNIFKWSTRCLNNPFQKCCRIFTVNIFQQFVKYLSSIFKIHFQPLKVLMPWHDRLPTHVVNQNKFYTGNGRDIYITNYKARYNFHRLISAFVANTNMAASRLTMRYT